MADEPKSKIDPKWGLAGRNMALAEDAMIEGREELIARLNAEPPMAAGSVGEMNVMDPRRLLDLLLEYGNHKEGCGPGTVVGDGFDCACGWYSTSLEYRRKRAADTHAAVLKGQADGS